MEKNIKFVNKKKKKDRKKYFQVMEKSSKNKIK